MKLQHHARSLLYQTRNVDDTGNGILRVFTYLERFLVSLLLGIANDPDIFIRMPDGFEIYHSTSRPKCGMCVRDHPTLWKFLVYPGFYFGVGYCRKNIEVEGDLSDFLTRVLKVKPMLHEMPFIRRLIFLGLKRTRRNSLSRAKSNIHKHYDLSNDFYKLWLDRELVYTCGYYPETSMSLEDAQFAKMDYICHKLRLRPGETVVEAGCGWGALPKHMARYYGVNVTAYNISHEQVKEARLRARLEGVSDRVKYIEDDYRTICGKFDVFVSVGMLEHVGVSDYGALARIIDSSLSPQGRGLIHSIGQNEPEPMGPWITKQVFAGSYTPTLREMLQVLEPYGFTVLDVENLRLHYAQTLQHWLERYTANEHEVQSMFDAEFVRIWRLYLAGSIAHFTTGSLQLFQVLFSRPQVNSLPISRKYLYADGFESIAEASQWNTMTH